MSEGEITGVSASSEFIIVNVRVKPGARHAKIEVGTAGELIVKVMAKPVEGAANAAVIEALSDFFDIAKSRITLSSGPKSKLKRFAITLQGSDDRVRIENLLQPH